MKPLNSPAHVGAANADLIYEDHFFTGGNAASGEYTAGSC